MISVRRITVLVFLIAFSLASIHAQDLSSYRDFQFGMSLSAVATQAGMNLAAAKMLHQRPAMIQELWWQRSFGESSPQTDPVREVVFSFYNGDLFRMVVNYDRYRTEGFTDDDMIEAFRRMECFFATRAVVKSDVRADAVHLRLKDAAGGKGSQVPE